MGKSTQPNPVRLFRAAVALSFSALLAACELDPIGSASADTPIEASMWWTSSTTFDLYVDRTRIES